MSPWKKRSAAGFLLVAVLALGAGSPDCRAEVPRAAPPAAVDSEAAVIDGLVKAASDKKKALADRRKAVEALGKRRARVAARHLHALLPGEYDVLTLAVVFALGEIGEPSSAAALERMVADAHAAGICIPGKINSAIDGAVRRCGAAKGR